MKFYRYLLLILCTFSLVSHSAGQNSSTTKDTATAVLANATNLVWNTDSTGIKIAILQGDPRKAGPFIERIIFPARWKIAPHWHPTTEIVTVIKGSLFEGIGDKFDKRQAKRIKEGGFILIPAKKIHYAFTKRKCIIQVQGTGPITRIFVNAK